MDTTIPSGWECSVFAKFHLHTVFLRTKYDSYGTVFVCTTFKAVKQREIIVHLACILRLESAYLQVDSNKAA